MMGTHVPQYMEEWKLEGVIDQKGILHAMGTKIDFGFIRELTAGLYSESAGRRSWDPELIFRMMIYQRVMNLSDRKLILAVRRDAMAAWFCRTKIGDKLPDQSSLSKIRTKWTEGGVFQKALDETVRLAMRLKLVTSGEVLAVDGSKILANASVTSLQRMGQVISFEKEDANAPDPDDPVSEDLEDRGAVRDISIEDSLDDPVVENPVGVNISHTEDTTVNTEIEDTSVEQNLDALVVEGSAETIDIFSMSASYAGDKADDPENAEKTVSARLYDLTILKSTRKRKRPPKEKRNPRKKGKSFRGEKLSNRTHRSTTDPDARVYKKGPGKEADLSYILNHMIDVDSRIIIGLCIEQAVGAAEPKAAVKLMREASEKLPSFDGKRIILGDRGYASPDFLISAIDMGFDPVVSMKNRKPEEEPTWKRAAKSSDIQKKRERRVREAQARNHVRFLLGKQNIRKIAKKRTRVEHSFSETKERFGMKRARRRGLGNVQTDFQMAAIIQNLDRCANHMISQDGESGAASSPVVDCGHAEQFSVQIS